MTKKQTELSEELREAVFEAARAGAAEAYTQNTGYVNYFKAMETLLYIPHQIEHSGEEHSEAPQRRVSLIHAHTEAQPETGHLLQCLCKADEH